MTLLGGLHPAECHSLLPLVFVAFSIKNIFDWLWMIWISGLLVLPQKSHGHQGSGSAPRRAGSGALHGSGIPDQAVLRLAAFWLWLSQLFLATIFCFAARFLHPVISLAPLKASSSLGQFKLNRGLQEFVHWGLVHFALISGQFFLWHSTLQPYGTKNHLL